MSQADEEINEMEDAEEHKLIMPHNTYTSERLDELYPAVEVPEAVDAGDPLADVHDHFLEAGLREADEIMKAAELRGRRRRDKEDLHVSSN